MKRFVLFMACVALGCSGHAVERPLSPGVEEIRPGVLMGYLGVEELPDSILLVAPVPRPDSALARHDEEMAERAAHAIGAAFEQAARDADVGFPQAMRHFSCPLGVEITEEGAPNLYRLMRRSRTDAAASVDAAKDHYQRPRPFMLNGRATCTPEKEQGLATNGSYPSGHAAIGWAWALILAELVPDRSDAILAWGQRFGESRMICNVHWHSDVQQGQMMAAATVARLHGDPVFRADLESSRSELERLRASNDDPAHECRD